MLLFSIGLDERYVKVLKALLPDFLGWDAIACEPDGTFHAIEHIHYLRC